MVNNLDDFFNDLESLGYESIEIFSDILNRNSVDDAYLLTRADLETIQLNIDGVLGKLERVQKLIDGEAAKARYFYQTQLEAGSYTINYAVFKSLEGQRAIVLPALSEGYAFIDALRTFFTGQEIKYVVGVEAGRGGKRALYEQEIPLSELIKKATLSYSDDASLDKLFTLKYNGGKTFLSESEKVKNRIVSPLKDNRTVYSAVYEYVKNKRLTSGEKISNGNVYEAYRRYISTRKSPKNKIPPSFNPDEFEKILNDIKKNNIASVKGGDLGLEQYKSMLGNSSFSFMGMTLMINTLTSVNNALKKELSTSNQSSLYKDLKSIFIQSNKEAATKLDKEAAKEARAYLKELLKGIS